MKRSLRVLFNDRLVGTLTDTDNIWSFRYAQSWLEETSSFDLSPSLPRSQKEILDGSSFRPVQWFFDNLLPEESAREVLFTEISRATGDAFGLLQAFGQESAGALTLLKEGKAIDAEGLRPLSREELSQRIRNLPVTPLSAASAKKMSLAGAQHKLAVVYQDGEMFEPVGTTLSTHILKPDHSHAEHYPHTVANEWFAMQLARRVGLSVPNTYVLRVPEPVYLIERFDRTRLDGHMHRLHILDGCQLFSVAGWDKYKASTLSNLRRLIQHCRNKAATRQTLFRWMLFNCIVGNGDAHLKNLSVFCDVTGMALTPHYDLLSTSVYREAGQRGAAELSWPIGEAKTFDQVKLCELIAFGAEIGLKPDYVRRTTRTLCDKVSSEAEALLRTVEEHQEPKLNAGELRHLRLIVHGVVRETTAQIRSELVSSKGFTPELPARFE